MEPRLQRRVQRYGWNKAVDHYERYWSDQLAPAQRRVLTLADVRPGERVLDVACGTGLVTLPAARAVGAAGHVTATDLSDDMIVRARETASAAGLANVTCQRMDAEALSLPDGSFDAALCALGLMYVPDPLTALREMRRVLRDGGRAVVAVWGARARCGWADIFPIVEARVDSDVCPMFFQLGSGDVLSATMTEAGFREVAAERIETLLHYDSADAACGAAFAGGPVALAYSHFDESTRAGAHADYLASITEYRSDQGYDIPGEFVVAHGRR